MDAPAPDADALLRDLDRSDEPAPSSRSPRRKRQVAAVWITVGMVVGAGIATPAVATVRSFLAQTGVIPQAEPSTSPGYVEETEVSLGSEWIDATARDYADFALTVYDLSLPLPADYHPEDVATRVAVDQMAIAGGEQTPVLTQETSVKRTYETAVRCVWINNWQAARKAGDVDEQAASAEILRQSASWPATVATDGGGIVEGLLSYAEAARTGNAALVASAYQSSACNDFMAVIDR
jgi:hypothetical protein